MHAVVPQNMSHVLSLLSLVLVYLLVFTVRNKWKNTKTECFNWMPNDIIFLVDKFLNQTLYN